MQRRTLLQSLAFASTLAALTASAQPMPTLAVTDLAYTQRVAQYFAAGKYEASGQVQVASHRSASGSFEAKGAYVAGAYSYLEQRELGAFSSDIRGALIRGTTYRLVQAKAFDKGAPQPTKAEQALNQVQTGQMAQPTQQPEVKDIVARIKKGEFNGADYVLFGTLSSVQFRDQLSPIQGTTTATYVYGLDLLADYSLIDTRTFEIKASFSAQGAGSDTKLLSNRGDVLPPNRAKVMRETSQSLAQNVYDQIVGQINFSDPNMARGVRPGVAVVPGGQPTPMSGRPSDAAPRPSTDQVMIYK